MTQQSKYDQIKDQAKDKDAAKTAREIELEIGETRTAITSDIRELNDKFSRANVKESAKDVMGGVKDAAIEQAAEIKGAVVDKAVEVKDAVVDKAIEMKDTAAEKVGEARDAMVETMEDVGEQAMRAGSATWRFAKANAVPLALFGASAAWLVANNRRTQDQRAAPEFDRRPTQPYRPVPRGTATKSLSARYMQDKFQRAWTASRDIVGANPLLTAMAVLATGMGVGMLLPSTDRENQLLAPSREKFQRLIGDVKDAAVDVAQVAKDTASGRS